MSNKYSEEEVAVLRSLFDSCDSEQAGKMHINQLHGLLLRLGKGEKEIITVTESAARIVDEVDGLLSFEDFVSILEVVEPDQENPLEGPDPKVMEFLRILEEYRIKCEDEGNYLEAGRAHKQLGILKKQEEKRQQKAIKVRQLSERQDVQLAHNMQFSEFNASWDKYMDEYDNMAQMYIQQMTERHSATLLEFQKQLRLELSSKPPKWSKELLEQRRKQHINARNKNYSEAQKIKKMSDITEEKERREMEEAQAIVFAKREAQFRLQQQQELQALLKRIECRRKEHIKQRQLDSKRLLQRNRNVQAVLETKQNMERQKLFTDIKKTLQYNGMLPQGQPNTTNIRQSTSSPSSSYNRSGGLNSSAKFMKNRTSNNGELNNITNISNASNTNAQLADSNGSLPSFLNQSGPKFAELIYADDGVGGGDDNVGDEDN